MEKKREQAEKDRQNQLQVAKEEKQRSLSRKKDRVLSACGLRNKYVCDSPRNLGKKEELPRIAANVPQSCRPTHKEAVLAQNNKLPPKPQGVPNYKIPPRPSLPYQKNVSLSTEERSKENLRNAGSRVVGEVVASAAQPNRMNRCSSAQKVIYPNWWC